MVFIRHEHGQGYAAANNCAIRVSRGEVIVLMNSDAIMQTDNSLELLDTTFRRHPKAGIVGAALYFANGNLQACGRPFLTLERLVREQLLFQSAFRKKNIAPVHPVLVNYVDGAFLAIRRLVIDSIGLLNENFFMYAEDMDWCLRAWRKGYQVIAQPRIKVMHVRGGSARHRFEDVLCFNIRSNTVFIAASQGEDAGKLSYAVYLVGMLLRIPLAVLRRSGLGKAYLRAFWRSYKMQSNLKTIFRHAV